MGSLRYFGKKSNYKVNVSIHPLYSEMVGSGNRFKLNKTVSMNKYKMLELYFDMVFKK